MRQQTLETVHTHTHTSENLIDINRVEQIYSICARKEDFYLVCENILNKGLFAI